MPHKKHCMKYILEKVQRFDLISYFKNDFSFHIFIAIFVEQHDKLIITVNRVDRRKPIFQYNFVLRMKFDTLLKCWWQIAFDGSTETKSTNKHSESSPIWLHQSLRYKCIDSFASINWNLIAREKILKKSRSDRFQFAFKHKRGW